MKTKMKTKMKNRSQHESNPKLQNFLFASNLLNKNDIFFFMR